MCLAPDHAKQLSQHWPGPNPSISESHSWLTLAFALKNRSYLPFPAVKKGNQELRNCS
jgi:hypothetical protein